MNLWYMPQMCANYKNLTGNISHAKLNKLQNSTYVKFQTVQCIETQSVMPLASERKNEELLQIWSEFLLPRNRHW